LDYLAGLSTGSPNIRIKKNRHDIQQVTIEDYNYKAKYEIYFIKNLFTPYLSSVYFGLIQRQKKKDYITINKLK
jgi:hypothetical protein